MASLANVTRDVRMIGKIAGASIIVIAVLFFLYRGGQFIMNTFFPTPLPPPEQAFGELPTVEFPAQTPVNYTYVVNTVTGTLPTFPDRITVYKTVQQEPNLVALQEARGDAANAGFTNGETKITDRLYRWSNRFGDRLEMDILNGNFKILSNYLNSAPPANGIPGSISNKEAAYEHVSDFIRRMGIATTGFSLENSRLTLLKLQNADLIEVENPNEAQYARLNIYQQPVDDYNIYYPNYPNSLLQFVLAANNTLPRIVEANFIYNKPNLEEGSTYYIKSSHLAFEELKRGEAVVYSHHASGSSVDITEVELGYYFGEEEQEYLLPIYVFSGPGFTAYVNALGQFIPQNITQ